jgi:hypothetical protein
MTCESLIGILVSLLFLISTTAADRVATSAMTGEWQRQARIIVAWSSQKNLKLQLNVTADCRVSGKIGEATLGDGILKRNRGRLGRSLRIKTDYIIEGNLQGPIIASQKITRKSVKIPLNFDGTKFTGGLHTSGKAAGGAGQMKLSASNLTLTRPEKPLP